MPPQVIIRRLAEIGRSNPTSRAELLKDVDIFRSLLSGDYSAKLEEMNSGVKNRELLANYLFLNAVLDQGPDMEGIRLFLSGVTNELYSNNIRFLHHPSALFDNLDRVAGTISRVHEDVKQRRKDWADHNLARPNSYNLFLDNAKQILPFVMFRWGTPLAVIERLYQSGETLLSHFSKLDSAEDIAQEMKDDISYGLGKAIGDKAAHLFVKWILFTYHLIERKEQKWSLNSYELPMDSNAGRVLFLTGYVFNFLPEQTLWANNKSWGVFTKDIDSKGKDVGTVYIRVTNLREIPIVTGKEFVEPSYAKVVQHMLNPSGLKTKPVLQLTVNAVIESLSHESTTNIGEIDDGLMFIGTNHCFNKAPKCIDCPMNKICFANTTKPDLKTKYHT